jgi:(p)ppGpp synthase/HD superfamily hydrolase
VISDADRGPDPELSFASDLPLTRAAVEFAAEQHSGQRRRADGASFMIHPLEAASLLERSGYRDAVVAAAVLHDVLEDTEAEHGDLVARFGGEVAGLVALVTDDPSIADEETQKDDVRRRVRAAGGDAPALYAADKVSKVRELRTLIATGRGDGEAKKKLARYWKSLAMLEQAMPGDRLVALLRFELEALEKLPHERA